MSDSIARDCVRTGVRAGTWQDAIRLAAAPLVERGSIEESYVDRMISSVDELVSPFGIAVLAQACLGVDLGQLLASHYPNTYIAWLDVTTPADLTFA